MSAIYDQACEFVRDLLNDTFFRGVLCLLALVLAGMILGKIVKSVVSRAYHPEPIVVDFHLV